MRISDWSSDVCSSDLLDAVRAAPGVALVLTAADIPGVNDISPTHRHDEPILAEDIVEYAGQPIFVVAAETRDQARCAARLAALDLDPLPAVQSFQDAMAGRGHSRRASWRERWGKDV